MMGPLFGFVAGLTIHAMFPAAAPREPASPLMPVVTKLQDAHMYPVLVDAEHAEQLTDGRAQDEAAPANAGGESGATAPADSAVASLSNPPRDSADPQVAVVIIGQLRSFLTPKVQDSQKLLIQPLQREFGRKNVHLYLCSDPGNSSLLETLRIAGAIPVVFEAKSATMFDHMRTCYLKTLVHAASIDPPLAFTWFVRSRFDNVFFEEVPPLFNLSQDAVYARARRIGLGWKNIDSEMMSYWMWDDVCDHQCVYRLTDQPSETLRAPDRSKSRTVDPSGKCMLMDDQFAYVSACLLLFCS